MKSIDIRTPILDPIEGKTPNGPDGKPITAGLLFRQILAGQSGVSPQEAVAGMDVSFKIRSAMETDAQTVELEDAESKALSDAVSKNPLQLSAWVLADLWRRIPA